MQIILMNVMMMIIIIYINVDYSQTVHSTIYLLNNLLMKT